MCLWIITNSPTWKQAPSCSNVWPIGCRSPHVFTNVKIALTNVGILHWGSAVEVSNYEIYDIRGGPFAHVSSLIEIQTIILLLFWHCSNSLFEQFDSGVLTDYNFGGWLSKIKVFGEASFNDVLVVCRTNNTQFSPCVTPPYYPTDGCQNSWDNRFFGNAVIGFSWYDVGQAHLISNITFRDCAPAVMAEIASGGASGVGGSGALTTGSGAAGGGGCTQWSASNGCIPSSAIWEFITHSDEFVPEAMQTTQGVAYEQVDPLHLFRFTGNWI